MTAEDNHQSELEALEYRIESVREDAPMWTTERLKDARDTVREARTVHVYMHDLEDGDE